MQKSVQCIYEKNVWDAIVHLYLAQRQDKLGETLTSFTETANLLKLHEDDFDAF